MPVRAYRIRPIAAKIANWPELPLQVNLSVPDDLRVTLAVLPIRCTSEHVSGQHAYNAGDVLTDQVISVLSRSASVNVISHFSVNAFRGRNALPLHVTEQLQADYVISGTYAQSGSALRVRMSVHQNRSGQVLWTNEFLGAEIDVIAAESELVGRIVSGIADAVMGLDNVLAVAGAAHGSYALVVTGLIISVPIVVWGSTLVLKVVDRYPGVVYIGAAVLVWTAVKMMTSEPLVKPWLQAKPLVAWLSYLAIPLVLWLGFVKNHRKLESRIHARLAEFASRRPQGATAFPTTAPERSEERRVGKEC